MPRMTGGDAIVDSLLRHGIDTIFGLPGVQMYGLFDAFARNANRLKVINARHEQTTAYMALGYAQSTGKPSAFTVVPGPGVMNTMGALTTAWGVNAPVMCITGQVPSAMIGRGRGQLHEMPDQLATLKTLLKFAERIEHPDRSAAGHGARLPGDDLGPAGAGRRRDAVGHVPRDRRRDADRPARQARRIPCPIPTRSRRSPSWSTPPRRR